MKDIISKLNEIEWTKRRRDALELLDIMNEAIEETPKLWDDKAVGYGDYHYVNKTNEGDMPIIGFVPAKAHMTIYFAVAGLDPYKDYLDKLGKYKRGKICLYLSNLDKVNKEVLKELISVYYQDVLDKTVTYDLLRRDSTK